MTTPDHPDPYRASRAETSTAGTSDGPDYRFTLANERTFLAWLRTSLSLLAAGVAVVQLVPAFSIPAARGITGGLLAALAVVAAGSGVLRWRSVENAIGRGRPLPSQRIPWVLAAGLVLLALFGLVLIVLRGAS